MRKNRAGLSPAPAFDYNKGQIDKKEKPSGEENEQGERENGQNERERSDRPKERRE
jgi:hypothetical protein